MKSTDPTARYTDNHEWARAESHLATIGITDFGQACFKEIIAATFPEVGTFLQKGMALCVLESSKAANVVEMPLSGTVVSINAQLEATPALVNSDCYGNGWLVKIHPSHPNEWDLLMTADQYLDEIGVFFRKTPRT